MDMTHPSSGHSQADDPIKTQHTEEEEHHESGASKMFRKVKARAKKFKNSLTKHGDEHDQDDDVEEEDDESDEQEPEKQGAPAVSTVNEVSHMRSYTTSQPVKTSDLSEKEDIREADQVPLNTPPHPAPLLSATEDVTSTFAHGEDENLGGHREVNTETPKRSEHDLRIESTYQPETAYNIQQGKKDDLLSEIKDSVSRVKSHHFDEKKVESGIGNDSPTGFGGKQGTELREDFPAKSHEFDQKIESGIGNHSPTGFGGEPKTVPRDEFPAKSHDFDQKIGSGIGNDSPTGFGGEPKTVPRDEFPAKSHDFDQKIGSGIGNDSPTEFGGEPKTVPRDEFPAKSHDFDQKIGSGIGNDSPTGFGGEPATAQREDFPAKSHEFEQTIGSGIGKDTGGGEPGTERREDFRGKSYEFDQELESAIGKDSPTRFAGESETGVGEGLGLKGSHGYSEESESGLDKNFPARIDDVKAETELGRDLPTGTNDQLSPEFSRPKEGDDFDSQAEQTRDETREPKPSTYTEMIGSATSFVTDKAIATHNVVASSLGYSGGQHESPITSTGTVAEKLTPDDEKVIETGSPVTTKLPLSGGGSGAEETVEVEDKGVSGRDYLAEKLKPGEDDKALSEMIAEKLNLGGGEKTTTPKEVEVAVEKNPSEELSEEKEHGVGVAVAEEGNGGGGMVGKIKGAYNYWLGGTTEEVKPKSPVSVEESSQSLGSTVGTKGFSDPGESGLGESGGSTEAVPVQRGI